MYVKDPYKLVEKYIGRYPNQSEVDFDYDGENFTMLHWNITEKPQPAMEQLFEYLPQVEADEISLLTITPREFVLGLMDLGVTKTQINTLLNSNDRAWAELTFASCIVRGNPLIDPLCGACGISPAQLDEIFATKIKSVL